MQGNLFTLSAPSGTGKTSLVNKVKELLHPNVALSISHTTRRPRKTESDGIGYHFVTTTTFKQMQAQSMFLECAKVFGNYYGTSKQWVLNTLQQGKDVILEIDWQGADQIRQNWPDSCSIFLAPPSLEILHQRLRNRGQDSDTSIKKRLAKAQEELSHCALADYLLINDDFDTTVQQLCSLIKVQRFKSQNQLNANKALFSKLNVNS